MFQAGDLVKCIKKDPWVNVLTGFSLPERNPKFGELLIISHISTYKPFEKYLEFTPLYGRQYLSNYFIKPEDDQKIIEKYTVKNLELERQE